MPDDDLTFTDRQARAVILAAEAVGFEREPELYEAWYDLDLHDDAQRAAKHLLAQDPAALDAAMVADEPIPADVAARRILDSGRFTCQDAEDVIELASDRGFSPPSSDLPLLPLVDRWDQAGAAVEFLWAQHPLLLTERLGERARIAPLPETVRGVAIGRWSTTSTRTIGDDYAATPGKALLPTTGRLGYHW